MHIWSFFLLPLPVNKKDGLGTQPDKGNPPRVAKKKLALIKGTEISSGHKGELLIFAMIKY